jgi:hypothetical protein
MPSPIVCDQAKGEGMLNRANASNIDARILLIIKPISDAMAGVNLRLTSEICWYYTYI